MRSATRKKTGKDPQFLEWLRTQPCACCRLLGVAAMEGHRATEHRQLSATEAAHVADRGLSQKCPDREAIPLCAEHHRLDTFSAHRMGKKFWAHYGVDKKQLIERLNRGYEEETS
jgi:hypothetical protein